MDDLTKLNKQDSIRINVHEIHELQYWRKELNVSATELCNAVQKVGVMVDDVREELKRA
ncbi:MAG: DUF3606 domain-containing protein [Sphingobacteriales bacterium]|nr:MAG: DUF3606 domain-containing protein [Sphingobacteriales bacterium]